MSDTYRTLKSSSEAEIKIKGSRFIARAFHAGSRADADRILEDIRRVDRDATHHCTAYRLGPKGEEVRFNDDGEPSGTAGRPILRQIEALDLTDTFIVVTRYYGGTKLGTGGLIRAYGDSAHTALKQASVRTVVQRTELEIQFGYGDTSQAMHALNAYDVEIRETLYGDSTSIRLGIRRSQEDDFTLGFQNALAGRGTVSRRKATG